MGRNSFRTPRRHPALDHATKLPCCGGFQPLISLNAFSPASGLVAHSFDSLPIQNRWRCTSAAAGQGVEKKFYPKINSMLLLGLDLSHLIGMRSRRERATFREDKGQRDRGSKGRISVSGGSTSCRLLASTEGSTWVQGPRRLGTRGRSTPSRGRSCSRGSRTARETR